MANDDMRVRADHELVAGTTFHDTVEQRLQCLGVNIVFRFFDQKQLALRQCQVDKEANDVSNPFTHRFHRDTRSTCAHIHASLLAVRGGYSGDHKPQHGLARLPVTAVGRNVGAGGKLTPLRRLKTHPSEDVGGASVGLMSLARS